MCFVVYSNSNDVRYTVHTLHSCTAHLLLYHYTLTIHIGYFVFLLNLFFQSKITRSYQAQFKFHFVLIFNLFIQSKITSSYYQEQFKFTNFLCAYNKIVFSMLQPNRDHAVIHIEMRSNNDVITNQRQDSNITTPTFVACAQ